MLKLESIKHRIVCLGLFFSAIVNVLSPSLNTVALYVVIPLMFGLAVFSNSLSFKTNAYNNKLILLYVWCLASFLWAKYPEAASKELHQILGCFLLTFIFAVYGTKQKLLPWLYCTYLILMLNCLVYASSHILMEGGEMAGAEDRLNDDVLDANTFSYYCIFCTFLVYILGEIAKKVLVRRVTRILFLLMLPFSFVIALLTASRQILFTEPILFLSLLVVRYIVGTKTDKRILFLLFSSALVLIASPFVLKEYYDSYLFERMQLDIASDSRPQLIADAFNVGLKHFPLGVGTGNYIMYSYNRHISHNTYVELWANVGIVGLILFCSMVFKFVKVQFQRFKQTKDKTYLAFFSFGVVFIIQQMFFSFYTGMWLMGFFILVCTHSETYYRNSQGI